MGATTADWCRVSATLAAAFADDPVWTWLLPDAARRPAALERFFAIEARDVVLPHGASEVAGDGAALVLPPGHWRTPATVQARHAAGYVRVFRERLPIALGVLTALERRHPRAPHHYLPYIGVRPAAQGRGLGTELMTPVLERCDRERLPAYLEASSADNARLYERLGFRTQRVVRPFGSPPIRLMARAPSAR